MINRYRYLRAGPPRVIVAQWLKNKKNIPSEKINTSLFSRACGGHANEEEKDRGRAKEKVEDGEEERRYERGFGGGGGW